MQVKQKNAKSLLKTLHLSYIIYTNAEAYKKPREVSKTEISPKTAKVLQLLTVFAKHPSQMSSWVLNTCYNMVNRKFPVYKLKQKMAKKVKN